MMMTTKMCFCVVLAFVIVGEINARFIGNSVLPSLVPVKGWLIKKSASAYLCITVPSYYYYL